MKIPQDRTGVLIDEGGETYDFVCCGHHHERELAEEGRTTVLNPGAHVLPGSEADRTIAILDTLSESPRFRSTHD